MPWTDVAIGTKSYQPRSGVPTFERLRNLYAEQNPANAKSGVTLYGTPGLSLWKTTSGSGRMRGMHVMGGNLYAVIGGNLYRYSASKTETLVGSIAGSGHVRMTDNGTHVAIATIGGPLYYANTSTIGAIPAPSNLNGATFQDGYGIFTQANTQNFWLSGLDDLTTISALDVAAVETLPDFAMGCISDTRELWLFKERSTEIWYNDGAAAFPFSRAQMIERGCAASGSIAKDANVTYWLGDDLKVYAASGYKPTPISTPGIDRLIAAVVSPVSAESFIYSQASHTFYVLSFDEVTIVYDITTGLWHERYSYNETRWRASHYAKFNGEHLVGDFESGLIYELDLSVYSENSTEIRREIVNPPIHGGANKVAISEIHVDMEMGVGLATGQGSDPQLMLDWTIDGGKTWSNTIFADIGAVGEYTRQARFNRLGMAANRSFRIAMSDPVKAAFVACRVRAEGAGT